MKPDHLIQGRKGSRQSCNNSQEEEGLDGLSNLSLLGTLALFDSMQFTNKEEQTKTEPGEMAQHFRALATLPRHQGFVPTTHIGWL